MRIAGFIAVLALLAAGLVLLVAGGSMFDDDAVFMRPEDLGAGAIPPQAAPVRQGPDLDLRPDLQPYTPTNALARLEQVRGALASFTLLTHAADGKLDPVQVEGIGNMDWQTQAEGFQDWTRSIEGVLKRQNYQIAKLNARIAERDFADGKLTRPELEAREETLRRTEQDLAAFLDAHPGVAAAPAGS